MKNIEGDVDSSMQKISTGIGEKNGDTMTVIGFSTNFQINISFRATTQQGRNISPNLKKKTECWVVSTLFLFHTHGTYVRGKGNL
uniref:Uncharacterized protein n=1 Tax=Rhizophora mucronata TaxID=61149 RepID=A0A2P2L6Q8_RHIMU